MRGVRSPPVVFNSAGGGLPLPQLLHRCCQVLSVLVGLHSCGQAAVELKPSNLLLLDDAHEPGAGQRLVLGDSQLHLTMARALREVWPTEAALADPYYK